jgi:hypothetical protein
MTTANYRRAIPDLLRDLVAQVVALLRMEGELARTEMSEKLGLLGRSTAVLVAGAVILIPALVVLLEAGVAALVKTGFESYVAALIAGGAALVVGVILLIAGARSIRIDNLAPRRTIDNLQRDVSVAADQMRHRA